MVTNQIRAKVAFLWESESSCRGLDGPSSPVTIGQIVNADQPDLVDCLFSVAREVSEGDDRVLIVILFSRLRKLFSVPVSVIFDELIRIHVPTHSSINPSIHQSINSIHPSHLPGHPAGGEYGYSFHFIFAFVTGNVFFIC